MTRWEYNESFERADLNPDRVIPNEAVYLWDWFFDLTRNGSALVHDGVAKPISWSEIKAWLDVREINIDPDELDVLNDMGLSFCEEMNEFIELESKQDD